MTQGAVESLRLAFGKAVHSEDAAILGSTPGARTGRAQGAFHGNDIEQVKRRMQSGHRSVCLLALAIALPLAGCQSAKVVVNDPLPMDAGKQPIYAGGYGLIDLLKDPKGQMILALAFSGGGKRSAAFAHGALQGLNEITFDEDGRQRTVLDEVDYISAVSGGTFPAMHYGIYREKSFQTFDRDFLKVDINAYIYGTFLEPWNWEWLIDPLYGTNDRMAEVYDRLMFHGATYADLLRNGLPLISVNATEIANGITFPFTQPTFDLLCSDLLHFPVARAVAASNGFPVLFTPITLTSYRQQCAGTRPPTAPSADPGERKDMLSRRAVIARNAERYLDPSQTRYVHLMDGGISDNLAMRSLINGIIALDDDTDSFRRVAMVTRRVLVVSVDGEAASDPTLNQQRVVTGLGQIFSAVSGTQIDAYNFETLLLAETQVKKLVERLKKTRCEMAKTLNGHDCADVEGNVVHLSLSDVADPEIRKRLQAIPTGLTIPDQDVDTLVSWGKRLVLENPEIRSEIKGLAAKPPGS
jgi:NTE family protein